MSRAKVAPKSINPEKDKVEGALETRKLIWGLIYDTETCTRSLPAAKIEKAFYLLHLPEFDTGNTQVPLKLMQELRGNQQYWLAVFPGLAPYLGATNDLLGPPDEKGMAVPRGDNLEAVWAGFWEAIELQRLLIDNQGVWETRFTHSLVGSLSLSEYLTFPGLQDSVVWASGDATTEAIGAVDWTSRTAVVESVRDLWNPLKAFLDESSGRPEGRFAAGEEEEEEVIISIAELLAVLGLVAARWKAWKGKIVIYAGDNQNVISWLASRSARPPAARYLLQVLAAAESTGHFRLYAEYIRTYHNTVADDLTRRDPQEVLSEHHLTAAPMAGQLQELLNRGWVRRALLWSTMEDSDKGAALQLCLQRRPPGPRDYHLDQPLGLRVFELASGPPVYLREATKAGGEGHHAQLLDPSWSGPTAPNESTQDCDVICGTLGKGKGSIQDFAARVSESSSQLLVVDSLTSPGLKALQGTLGPKWDSRLDLLSGRSFEDQVWWRRWVLVARKISGKNQTPLLNLTHPIDEEPVTMPLQRYDLHWKVQDSKAPPEAWLKGELKLDRSLPYLKSATPKPVGHLKAPNGSRQRLVWDPSRPLPALHHNCWNPLSDDSLVLLGANENGVGTRALLPQEAVRLLGGRTELLPKLPPEELASHLLFSTPPLLAAAAVAWLNQEEAEQTCTPLTREGPEDRFDPGDAARCRSGVCNLPWEEHTKQALMSWLEQRGYGGWRESEGRVGGSGAPNPARARGRESLPGPRLTMPLPAFCGTKGRGKARSS